MFETDGTPASGTRAGRPASPQPGCMEG
jgi:hypothetical protein